MTRIAGSTDFVGASGGLLSRGNLYLYARNTSGPGHWFGSGIAADLQTKNNIVLRSNESDINLYAQDMLFSASNSLNLTVNDIYTTNNNVEFDVGTAFYIGDSDYSDAYTPDEVNIYSNGIIRLLNGIYDTTNENGISLIGGNTLITTLGSQIPTINGSGIALDNYVPSMARFYGRPDGDQDLSSSFEVIPWNSLVKSGITHTDGEDEVYLPTVGVYFINCFLTTDFSCGGHIIQIRLEHYNGFTTQIKVIRPGPTTSSNRNSIDVAYTIQTLTVNDYIRVRAQCSADTLPDGVVWKFEQSGLNIVKM